MRPARLALLLLLPVLAACGQSTPAADVARPAAAAEQPGTEQPGTAQPGTAQPGTDQPGTEQPGTERAPDDPPAVDPVTLLRGVPAAAEAAGSVRYSSVTETALEGEAPRTEGRLAGALDLTADAGTGVLRLPGLGELAAQAGRAGEASASADLQALAELSLSWTATDVTAVVAGERHTAARGGDNGVVGRVPAEPAGLLDAVGAATDVTVAGQEDVDGVPTTHLTATLEPQAAVDAGLGTQAQLGIARTAAIPVEAWVDADGRPARIRFTADVPSLQGGTRTLTTTYDYRGWGEPVDVTP